MSDEPPQVRPGTTGGPFAHQYDAAGVCRVCKRAAADLAGTGCPLGTYKDDGKRLTDARTFEAAARRLWEERTG